MKKIKFLTIIWLLFYILIFSFLLYNSYHYLDPDLGWHLQVGKQILDEKNLPGYEYYNYTLEGKKWVDHEWPLNIATYWLYKNFGYFYLNLFFAFIILAVLIIQNIFIQKCFLKNNSGYTNKSSSPGHSRGAGFIMLFQLFGVLAMAPHLGIRMQEITLLNLLLLLIIIYQYTQRKNNKILLWLLPLFYFWACVHGGFLIGLFIILLWLAIKIIELIISKINAFYFIDFTNKLKPKKILLLSFFLLIVIGSTLLTPYGLKLYSFLQGYTNTFYMKNILEWLPFYYWPIKYKQLLYSAIISATLIFLVYTPLRQGKTTNSKLNKNNGLDKIDLWPLILTFSFLILSFKSKRHFPLLYIASFPLLIKFYSQHLDLPDKIKIFLKNSFFIKFYLVAGLLLSISGLIIKTNFTANPFTSPLFCQAYPCQAVNFLKEDPRYFDKKLFNNYGWGGFLIWGWPEKKLFIDGRLPQYNYAGHTLLEEYCEFFNEGKTANKLNQYQIKLVLLKINKKIKFNWFEKYVLKLDEEKFNNKKNYLKEYLDKTNKWKLIYTDKISRIYFYE